MYIIIERELKDHDSLNGYTYMMKHSEFDLPCPFHVNVESTEWAAPKLSFTVYHLSPRKDGLPCSVFSPSPMPLLSGFFETDFKRTAESLLSVYVLQRQRVFKKQ